MYLGSVKFFKHLFASLFLLAVLIPALATVRYWILLTSRQGALKLAFFEEGSYNADGPYALPDQCVFTPEDSLDSGMLFVSLQENPDYESLFPELFTDVHIKYRVETPKTAFLTFDDGPSLCTIEILDILKENDIKATFFIIGDNLKSEKNQEILKRIAMEGHSVGVHTMSHKYVDIYSSVESFLIDFNEAYEVIYTITGVKPEIFRFPGGSINGYNMDIYQELISEMIRRGFTYYDWNVSAADTKKAASIENICNNVIYSALKKNRAVILMHDSIGKKNTVDSIQTIIDALKENGFTFLPLTKEVRPVIFGYKH